MYNAGGARLNWSNERKRAGDVTNSNHAERLADLTLTQFLAALADDTPTPGGGAVSALAGALGGALMAMVAGLTLGRPRYAPVAAAMIDLRRRANALQAQLMDLADVDAEAYDAVIAASRSPQTNAPGREAHDNAVQDALRRATDAPLAVAAACVDVLTLAARVTAQGNRNAAGDAAVGALMASAGLRGAARNVRINLADLRDTDYCEAASSRIATLLAAGQAALAQVLDTVNAGG